MGVTGLIKFVEAACEDERIESFRGCTVAIDSYCLLHKGAYSCSDKLVQGVKTTAYIDYIMKYIKMLQHYKINIIMVFDGMANTSKAQTEKKRKESRSQAKAKGAELLAAGFPEEAKKEFDKAVEIKHEHALALMEACRNENIDCITSMYEADAQLAYLNKIGLAEYVISEDSDLILFGCKKIIFKLSLTGSCVLFDANKLHLSLKCPEDKFSFEKFRRIAIMSGCDYLDSLPGIGLAKAAKFMMLTAETDMRKALLKVPAYLKMGKLKVTDEYIEGFLKAEAAFKYMFVYDPIKKKMVRLNELEDSDEEEYCSQTGRALDNENAYQLALGNINPRTFKVVANFDPLKAVKKNKKLKSEPHLSIWKCNLDEFRKFAKSKPTGIQQPKITSFVPVEKVSDPKVREIIEQENCIDESFGEEQLLNKYKIEFHSEISSRSKKTIETSTSEVTRNNPFAKQTTESSLKAEETSFISKVVVPDRVVSRFFLKKPRLFEPTEEMKRQALINRENIKAEIEERLEENRKFYANVKKSEKLPVNEVNEEEIKENSNDDEKEIKGNEDSDDVVLVSADKLKVQEKISVQSKSSLFASKSCPGKSSLGLKRKAPQISNAYPKLAKFGFTRNSQ